MPTICRTLTHCAAALTLLSGPVMAWDDYPDQTADGLDRIESKKVDALYWKEGATLGDYNRVRIADAEISFRNNWLRDQNRSRRSPSDRVTEGDMDNIRAELAEAFRTEFTKELQEGGYEVVEENGADVLLLEPAIVDLDVTAPDVSMRQTGMSRTYTTSAGEMTLDLSFRDSVSNALIGRAIDHREDHNATTIQYSSRITNRAEAERILRRWAGLLREALDDAHGK